MSNEIKLNSCIALDISEIDSTIVPQIIGTQINHTAAALLSADSLNRFWYALILFWNCVHTSLRDVVQVDQRFSFTSQIFKTLLSSHVIKLNIPGAESDNLNVHKTTMSHFVVLNEYVKPESHN